MEECFMYQNNLITQNKYSKELGVRMRKFAASPQPKRSQEEAYKQYDRFMGSERLAAQAGHKVNMDN
jgi:hypothetical protein